MKKEDVDFLLPEDPDNPKLLFTFQGDTTQGERCFTRFELLDYQPPRNQGIITTIGTFSITFFTDRQGKKKRAADFVFCDKYFVDLDRLDDHTKTLDQVLAKKTILPELLYLLDFSGIPEPSRIINTGHGIQVFWKVEKERSEADWIFCERLLKQAVFELVEESEILSQLVKVDMSIGGNPRAKCRLVNSMNVKGNKPVKVKDLYTSESITTTADLTEILELLVDLPKPKKPKDYIRQTSKDTTPKKYDYDEFQKKGLRTKHSLDKARHQDLWDILHILNRENRLIGYRYHLLYIFASTERFLHENFEDYFSACENFNACFCEPQSDKELRYVAESAWNYKKDERRWSNKKIIEILSLKDEDLKDMKTIITPEIKQERKRSRQKEKQALKSAELAQEKYERDKRIIELYHQKKPYKVIEKIMKQEGFKVSTYTISIIVNEYKNVNKD